MPLRKKAAGPIWLKNTIGTDIDVSDNFLAVLILDKEYLHIFRLYITKSDVTRYPKNQIVAVGFNELLTAKFR